MGSVVACGHRAGRGAFPAAPSQLQVTPGHPPVKRAIGVVIAVRLYAGGVFWPYAFLLHLRPPLQSEP